MKSDLPSYDFLTIQNSRFIHTANPATNTFASVHHEYPRNILVFLYFQPIPRPCPSFGYAANVEKVSTRCKQYFMETCKERKSGKETKIEEIQEAKEEECLSIEAKHFSPLVCVFSFFLFFFLLYPSFMGFSKRRENRIHLRFTIEPTTSISIICYLG